MRTEYFELIGSDGTALQAVLWQPETPRAVLQIVHGMTEHMGRYRDFAAALAEQGIAVAGFDLRCHGKNPGDPEVHSLPALPGPCPLSRRVTPFRHFFKNPKKPIDK